MNFSKTDLMILLTMSIAVIAMSFTMPALGLGGDAVNETEIPEFDIATDRFDFAGEFPDSPGSPTTGTLTWDSELGQDSDNFRELRETDTGNVTNLVAQTPAGEPQVTFTYPGDTAQEFENYETTTEGDRHVFEPANTEWEVLVTFTSIEGNASAGWDFTVEYEIREQPQADGGTLSSVPILGSVLSGGSYLAGIVSWIGSIMLWFVSVSWQIALNAIGMLFDVTAFLFETATWLVSTYGSIVSGAESWASVFVAIPGLLLTLELGKLVFIGISLLPTT